MVPLSWALHVAYVLVYVVHAWTLAHQNTRYDAPLCRNRLFLGSAILLVYSKLCSLGSASLHCFSTRFLQHKPQSSSICYCSTVLRSKA